MQQLSHHHSHPGSDAATFDQETHTTTAQTDNMALATRSSRLRVRRLRWAFDAEGETRQVI